MAVRWYIPGLYQESGTWRFPSYRRMYLVDTFTDAAEMEGSLPGITLGSYHTCFLKTLVNVAGVANRSPVVMEPNKGDAFAYRENFRSRRFFEDCQRSENMSLDLNLGMLRPSRYSMPAQITYAFEVPEGRTLSNLSVGLGAALFKGEAPPPSDSRLETQVSSDGEIFQTLGVIDQDSFPVENGKPVFEPALFFEAVDFYRGRCRKITTDWSVDPSQTQSRRLYIRVIYHPGKKEGFLNVTSLAINAEFSPVATQHTAPASGIQQAANLLHNVNATLWEQNVILSGPGVFAFAAEGFWPAAKGVLRVNPPSDLTKFLARHPDAALVHTLADESGTPLLSLYDANLAERGIRLSKGRPSRTIHLTEKDMTSVGSISLMGDIRNPSLIIGDRTWLLPIIAPAGSILTLNAGGSGRLFFSLRWKKTEDFTGNAVYNENVRAGAAGTGLQDGITASDLGEGVLAYTFVSAFPFKELRIQSLPRVYGNPCKRCGENYAGISISTDDGRTYSPLYSMTAQDPCDWSPVFLKKYARIRFKNKQTSVIVAFRMHGKEEAGFRAPDNFPGQMVIEADLDTRLMERIDLPGQDFSLRLAEPDGNDVTIDLHKAPVPLNNNTIRVW